MKKYFTVGDISKIYNISVHSIRHYHKINLIVPTYVDENTGYRYYTFEQFQYFSRLKYLRSLGLSLNQIKKIFSSGDVKDFKSMLKAVKRKKLREIDKLNDSIEKIDWINNYYSFNDKNDFGDIVYKNYFEDRYVFQSFCSPDDSLEEIDVNIHKKLNTKKYRNLNYLRQFGYVLKYDSLLENRFDPISTTLLLYEKPSFESEDIKYLPRGNYLCYCTYLLSTSFDITPVKNYINTTGKTKPRAVVAFEYEDNLKEFYNALYEIQILF